MAGPVQTPNRATTTNPQRSSKRIAHKAPLGWLPWLALLLIALLLAGAIAALLALRDDDDSATPSSTASKAGTSSGASSGTSPVTSTQLTAVAAAALVGGGGASPTGATADALKREAGTAGTVLFASDSAAIDTSGMRVIAAAASGLEKAGIKTVEVVGYTDVIAGQPVNATLSQQRADAVAEALQALLPGLTVTTSAKGETDPIAPNTTEQGRQQNRRAAILARS
jgi:outer membrane protein OmpA-like peptidoglycan-associated protein